MNKKTPYDEGYHAGVMTHCKEDNPYAKDGKDAQKYKEWCEGFEDGILDASSDLDGPW